MTRKNSESGFALLFVFAMAAIIAAMLYLSAPQAAFEAQRVREDILIERGEQYYRAIQLYVRKVGGYPSTLEQLENTNNVRFLRRRYKDPMTGKADWRLIHAGPGGFPDSLTRKPPAVNLNKDAKDNGQTTASSTSTPAPDAQKEPEETVPLSFALRRRWPGSKTPSGGNGAPGADLQMPGGGNQSGFPEGPEAGLTGQPGQTGFGTGNQGQAGGGALAVQPADPYGNPQQAQQAINNNAGQQPGGNNAALQAIINGLTGRSTQVGAGGLGGTQLTGGTGIAGVASKYKAIGIKSYNKHKKYNEWEFIYDPQQDLSSLSNTNTGPGYNPGPGMNTGSGTNTSFGTNTSSGMNPNPTPQPPQQPQ